MIPASLYQTIFLFLVVIFTMNLLPRYTTRTLMMANRKNISNIGIATWLCIFYILFIGYRPVDGIYFVDMISYAQTYDFFKNGGPFLGEDYNFIFDPLFYAMAVAGVPVRYFFLLIATIYFSCIYIACRKIFPNDLLLTFISYLGAFSTFSFGVNGIKAGAAASLFLVAVAYRGNKKIAIPFLVLTLGFHHSMIAPICAYVIAFFIKKRKWFLYGWLASLLMAALHVTYFMVFFASQVDEHGASYLNSDDVVNPISKVSGFRPDFIIYSAVPIFLGNYLINKYRIKSDFYDFIWSVYTITNSVFLLCTYGTFINRIAYLSWLLYPIVLLYPFLNIVWSKRQNVYLKNAVWGHLGFTLFMVFIYYGLLSSRQ